MIGLPQGKALQLIIHIWSIHISGDGFDLTLLLVWFRYSKWKFFIIGFSMALSSLLFNYSVSGSRTPPYLQAILSNLTVPVQFLIRYFTIELRNSNISCMWKNCQMKIILTTFFVSIFNQIFVNMESVYKIKNLFYDFP